MPKQTFFNLKDEKRQKIENTAIKEFATYGFHGARLNNIVQDAGIAKGSFYQYFEDLDDLFIYLIITFTKLKMDTINSELKKHKNENFFSKIAAAQKAGLHFANEMGEEMMRIVDQSIPAKILESEELKVIFKQTEESFYTPLIREALAKREIQGDEDFIYVVISHAGKMINQYLMNKKHTTKLSDILKDEEEFDKAVDLVMNFIKKGLLAAE